MPHARQPRRPSPVPGEVSDAAHPRCLAACSGQIRIHSRRRTSPDRNVQALFKTRRELLCASATPWIAQWLPPSGCRRLAHLNACHMHGACKATTSCSCESDRDAVRPAPAACGMWWGILTPHSRPRCLLHICCRLASARHHQQATRPAAQTVARHSFTPYYAPWRGA